MSNLFERLRMRDPAGLLIATRDRSFTVAEILDRCSDVRVRQSESLDRRIWLREGTPFENLIQLIAWDGFSRELALCRDDTRFLETSDSLDDRKAHADFHHPPSSIWWLASSGTTGPPKWVAHQSDWLSRAVRPLPGTRWLLTYPVFRMAGLLVTLQALLGQGVLCVPASIDFDEVVATGIDTRANSISATPTWWRKLLTSGEASRLRPSHVTLGGEIADQATLNALASLFCEAQIRHVYASTEVGAAFTVRDGREGFPSSWLQHEVSGLRLAIRDDELYVRRSQAGGETEAWIATGDLVELDPRAERCLFLGRKSGVINVGGDKVHPEKIESLLLGVAGVRECLVYARRNPIVGNLVAADIVADAPEPELRAEIMQRCRQNLQRWETPALLRFVDQLELTTTGKRRRQLG